MMLHNKIKKGDIFALERFKTKVIVNVGARFCKLIGLILITFLNKRS